LSNEKKSPSPKKTKAAEKPASPVRIVVHIGAGKTGTSSIQETLRYNSATLRKHGIHYLGLMLEDAPLKKYDWQRQGAFMEFFGRPEAAGAEFREVLEGSIDVLVQHGGHTFIISNESLLTSGAFLLDILAALKAERGWSIDIVAYVRNYASWTRSSYIQWGLKHKTYSGKLKPYRVWVKNNPLCTFAPGLTAWDRCPELPLQVRNLDQAGNAVIDFCSTFGLPVNEVSEVRSNDAPSPEELVLRTIFNSRFEEETFPLVFERLFGYHALDFSIPVDHYLDTLLPSQADIAEYLESKRDDAAVVNALLERSGQKPLSLEPTSVKPMPVDLAKVSGVLFLVIMQLGFRLNQAEAKINALSSPDANKHK